MAAVVLLCAVWHALVGKPFLGWALHHHHHHHHLRDTSRLCGRPGDRGGPRQGGSAPCRAIGIEVPPDRKLYEVLGVPKDASVTEIKRAFYREAKDCHPDTHPDDEVAGRRFQEVADAYQTLADPVRRQKYDLEGLAGLAYLKTNATRLFGPPPWQVLIGKTRHWLWEEGSRDNMIGLLIASIPHGIAGVTLQTVVAAYDEAYDTDIGVLLNRVSEEQARDTVEAIEEFGLAVKAEPIEAERSQEKETPLMYFRRIQRELGQASEHLRMAAQDLKPMQMQMADDDDFEKWIDTVRSLRSELRAAARELEEFKLTQVK